MLYHRSRTLSMNHYLELEINLGGGGVWINMQETLFCISKNAKHDWTSPGGWNGFMSISANVLVVV